MSVHPEAGPHLNRTLKRIRELGAKAGVVFNPSTDPDAIAWMMSFERTKPTAPAPRR